jgi:hypothetical protein
MKVYLHFVNVHKVQKDQKSSVGCTEIYFYVMYNVFVEDEILSMLKNPIHV